ncbi:MAG: reverse gyrase [Nitrososphaeria archaeon]
MKSETEELKAVFDASCPNCGGPIEAERLKKGLVCSRCLPEEKDYTYEEMLKELHKRGTLKLLKEDYEVIKGLKDFSEFFRKAVGSKISGAQRLWAIRLLRNENYAITSPPGAGKTTFGLVVALYMLKKKKKSLIVVPTRSLASQSVQRLFEYGKKLGINLKVFTYNTKNLKISEADVAVVTSKYLFMHYEDVESSDFKFVFVDDVDAALKSNKSIRLVLRLAGFSEEEIEKAKNMMFTEKRLDLQRLFEIRKKMIKRTMIFSSGSITRSSPLFLVLMGFRPGSPGSYPRNVIDLYEDMPQDLLQSLKKRIGELGDGGLIFVTPDLGADYAEYLSSKLNEQGIRSAAVSGKNVKVIEEFKNGKYSILIGVATHYGTLVRGIDIPEKIRYAIFIGIPRFKFTIGEKMHPVLMTRILTSYALYVNKPEINRLTSIIRRKITRLSPAALQMLAKKLKEGNLEDQFIISAYNIVNEALKDKNFLEKLGSTIGAVVKNGSIYVPDIINYIQASGRTSRMRSWGNTLGLSFLYVDDQNLFQLFKKISSITFGIEWKRPEEVDIKEILKRIDRDRIEVKVEEQVVTSEETSKFSSTLMIVESPHKAKTIANFFSRPAITIREGIVVFETVVSGNLLSIAYTAGHVIDLTLDKVGYHGVEIMKNSERQYIPHYAGIKDCENGHQVTTAGNTCPICGARIVRDKVGMINALEKLAFAVDTVLIGTDPDTEGEKISWDIYNLLRPFNSKIKRVEFHEVTKPALLKAISESRNINENLVKAQVVRRLDDRWLGFELSTRLQNDFWKSYCKEGYGIGCDRPNRNLSAGRVQTPVLGWIIERYRQYNDKKNLVKAYSAHLEGTPIRFYSEQVKLAIGDEVKLRIIDSKISEEKVNPPPPYTMSEILRDAANILKLSASEISGTLQDLFEAGFITYPRTDSTRVSEAGISVAKNYITQILSLDEKQYFYPRKWGEGGAHEAIRPTKPLSSQDLKNYLQQGLIYTPIAISWRHYAVYDLIFRRFIASQMAPATVRKQIISLSAEKDGTNLTVDPNPLEIPLEYVFDGFARVLPPYRELRRPVSVKEASVKVENFYEFRRIELYSEGDLVEEMKRKGIGRPSTYSTIIQTILIRRYAILSGERKKIVPTKLGIAAYSFLKDNFWDLVNDDTTSKLEAKMDLIENGSVSYRSVLDDILNELITRLNIEVPFIKEQ